MLHINQVKSLHKKKLDSIIAVYHFRFNMLLLNCPVLIHNQWNVLISVILLPSKDVLSKNLENKVFKRTYLPSNEVAALRHKLLVFYWITMLFVQLLTKRNDVFHRSKATML